MSGLRYTSEVWTAMHRSELIEREIRPVDARIEKLRADIRTSVRRIQSLKAEGHATRSSVRTLAMLYRTLDAERRYRNAVLKLINSRLRA